VIGNPHFTDKFERWRIREPSEFIKGSFRTHDIGRKGFSKRIAGKLKKSGKWATQAILISRAEPEAMKKKLRQKAQYMYRQVEFAKGMYGHPYGIHKIPKDIHEYTVKMHKQREKQLKGWYGERYRE